MSFNIDDCAIPSVWCGKGNPPKRKRGDAKYYSKTGSRYQCMQYGFGAGAATERSKRLPKTSLQHIKYVGDVYEKKFKDKKIATLAALVSYMNNRTSNTIEKLLKGVFTKRNGGLDKKAYNSTVLYLYGRGKTNVPKCSKI